MFKIFRYLKSYKKGRSFKTWAYRILVNSSYDFLRKKRKYEQVIATQKNVLVVDDTQPEHKVFADDIRGKIQSALTKLSPREKAVFLLRDSEGLSVQETSLVLKCSPMSVRTHLSRARHKIKTHLEKKYSIKAGRCRHEMP
jgi:RNA polymerase sigma-70 factor (ECF subfamily)